MAGKGSKPGERRGGRQKGTPNKINADLKQMILGALEASGGQAYLEKQAAENPVAFLTLIGKILPLTLQGDPNRPITLTVVTGVPRAPYDEDDERTGDTPVH
jgi:hypothetical protein